MRDAALRLDYWPNLAARSLRQSRTHVLGVLLPDLYGDFFSEVIRGIDDQARLDRFQVLISSSHAESQAIDAAARSLRGRVDGLIVMAPSGESTHTLDRIAHKVPVVLLNASCPAGNCSVVSIANYQGAQAAVGHLLELGHRVVAMIKGPPRNADAEERLRGFRQALAGCGIQPLPALEFAGDFTEYSGYRAAEPILAARPRPTAVFAANDYMAIGFLSALGGRGIRVPEDMALVGFDDIAMAQYISPALTTVHIDAHELGARAVRLLISSVGSDLGNLRRNEVLPATLVVRQSSGSRRNASTIGPDARASAMQTGESTSTAALTLDPETMPEQSAGRASNQRPSAAGRRRPPS